MARRHQHIQWVERDPDPDKRIKEKFRDIPLPILPRKSHGPGDSRETTRNHQYVSILNDNSNHVTRPVKSNEYVVDINSCPNHLASIITHAAGGNQIDTYPNRLVALERGLDRECKAVLNEIWPDSMHGLKAYPNFELKIDHPRYLRPVSGDTSHALGLCAAYRCYHANLIAEEIRHLVSDLKYLRQEHKEYLTHIEALEDLPIDDIATQYQRITKQLEEEEAKFEDFAKFNAPDESVRRQLLRKTTSLERILVLLSLHLSKKLRVETVIMLSNDTAKDILKEYEESRSSLFEQLRRFKIITGSDMMLTTPTTGVFIFSKDNFQDYYNFFLKDLLADVLTKTEHKDLLLSCPTRYYYEVPRTFKYTLLRDAKLQYDTFDSADNLQEFIEAWECADVVATFDFDDSGCLPQTYGYALFKCKVSERMVHFQVLKHFEDPSLADIKILQSHSTTLNNGRYKTNAIIAYSFSGPSSDPAIDLPGESSDFIVITQNAVERTDCFHGSDGRYQCCDKCHGQHYGCDMTRTFIRGYRN